MGEVTLSWTEPLHSNGIITKYILYYGSIKTGEVKYQELTADVRTFKVRHLSPTDAYIFKLAAHTSAGDSKKTTLSFDLSKGIYNFSLKPKCSKVNTNLISFERQMDFSLARDEYFSFHQPCFRYNSRKFSLFVESKDLK